MEFNKLFDGSGKVIIRSLSDRKILNKEYKEGDVIAYLDSVNIGLTFSEISKTADSRSEFYVTDSNSLPTGVIISNIKNNTVLEKLLFTPITRDLKFTFSNTFDVSDLDNGVGYMTVNIDNILSYLEVRSLNEKGETIQTELDSENQTLTFKDYDGSKKIISFILVSVEGEQVSLEKESQEYLSLEIQFTGKRGLQNGYYIVSIPTAQIVNPPQYEFENGNLMYSNELIFTIMNSRTQKVSMGFVSE